MNGAEITHIQRGCADGVPRSWRTALTIDAATSPALPAPGPGLEAALRERFESLPGPRVRPTRIATVPLCVYPEGAVLPDPDMMATLVVPIEAGISATAFVSFPPEDALGLIAAWAAEPIDGAAALACYRRGARGIADAALRALEFEAAPCDRLEEDALVATLHATHAPPDTAAFCCEVQVELPRCTCTGVFVLLAEPKALAAIPR